ncbi:protein ECT2 isoform X3 [Planococcus citri]|uniref:protein ECT2 isoform X3 n=1 Tax=Planococcus citri TaxID=170843 RepID=UPI0031F94B42
MTTNRRFVVMKILYARLGSDFCFRMMYVNVFKTVNWIFKMDNLKIVCSKMPPHLILLKDVAEDTEVVRACELFKVPVTVAEDIQTNPAEDVLSIYVVNSFENVEANGANYRFHAPARKSRKPRRSKKNHRSYVGEKNFRILGRTAILEMAKKREELGDEYFPFSTITKPLYCHALSGQVICFTGFKKEDELLKLKLLVHHMGGSVRKEMHCKVTHLIAKLCSGEKYFYAMTFRVPVVSEMWVHDAWQNRNVIGFNAAENDFISQYKLKPFHGSRICFLGYPEEEKNHMIEVLRENGGEPTDIVDQNCTHLVTDKSLNSFRVLSMISYSSYKRPSTSFTPDSANSTSDAIVVPPKKLKFDPENTPDNRTVAIKDDTMIVPAKKIKRSDDLENLDPNSGTRNEKIYKPLTVLGESNLTRRKVRKRTGQKSVPTVFEITARSSPDNKQSSDGDPGIINLDPFVERLPSSFQRNRSHEYSEDVVYFCTPPGPNYSRCYPSNNTSYLSIESLDERGQNQDELINYSDTVVDETKLSAAPPLRPTSKTFVVKAEWFWTSVQNEGRENEKKFIFDVDSNATPQSLNDTPICATSSTRARKRKRLKDRFPSFGSDLSPGQSAQKRRSSACDVTRQSEGSFLDYTASPDFVDVRTEIESPSLEKSKNTARFHKFMELWQTETNYVGILRTIMTLFKASLEKMVDTEAQLLNATELKIIFGHLPPIYSAHCDMLEELKEMVSKWSDDISVGELILKYSDALVKAYPPFINFFENTREMLIRCDKTKPRFHAFLKVCQSKPECGRQSLQDLLIRPVQRLPSINLLLNDILRYTSKNSVDYKALEKAIASLQDVMAHINEDKRKTEGQVALFDIFNEIENCPAYLVSSHRCFISRCEVTELSDNLSGRGNPLVLFLFSDVIEVCKKRKAFNNLKSPKENSGSVSTRHNKLYKHVKLLPLNSVLKVIDINETEDCHNIFALRVKSCQDLKESKEKTYSFTITDECIQKTNYLRMLCSQIANIVCRTDTDSYLMYSEAHQFDIDSSEVATGTLGKAFNRFATKTRIKVGRALSFNKTPNKLKRAVSTMMSPFGNQNGLTPSTQLANLQLAALPNIPVTMRM